MAVSGLEIPSEFKSIDAYKASHPTIQQQNQQLQIKIFESSRKVYTDLLGILYSSEIKKVQVKSSDDDDPIPDEAISHIPSNIMRCPVVEKVADINVRCKETVDALPHIIDLDNPVDTLCPVHKQEMVWRDWDPPCTNIGFKSVIDMVTSTMSESIANSTFPKEFNVPEYALGYAEGILETLYNNDEWVNNRFVFLNEGFNYNLENTIMTNIEAAIYKSKSNLVEKMIKSWNVNEDVEGRSSAQGKGVKAAFRGLLGI